MAFYAVVRRVMDPLADDYEFELVFTDNHNTGKTPDPEPVWAMMFRYSIEDKGED
jgi:hypothetical protein